MAAGTGGRPTGPLATLVAEQQNGDVVGFAFTTASRDDDGDDGTGEVVAIYAHPDAIGTGAGRELMAAAVAGLRTAGFRSATLWVLDSNTRARRFYERAGFRPDGASKTEDYAGATITELRYRRQL